MDADGANPVQLTGDAFNDFWPSWSPDGARITFTSDRYGAPEIMAMNADGSHQTNLSGSPGADVGPAWGPGDLPPANSQGPRISNLDPPAAATTGGSLLTISGAGLEEHSRITIGGLEAPVVEFLDAQTMTVAAPPHPAGVVDAMVTNPDGRTGILTDGFRYHQPFFTDAAPTAGVAFEHFRDPVDRIPLGAGVVIFDFNNDGLQDIYVASKPSWSDSVDEIDGANALYRNDGDGTFTDVAAEAGVDELMDLSNGGCAADYDNDGDQDLYWMGSTSGRGDGPGGQVFPAAGRMLEGFGDGSFRDITIEAQLLDILGVDYSERGPDDPRNSLNARKMNPKYHENGKGLAHGDLNGDGFVDLIGTNSSGPVWEGVIGTMTHVDGPLFVWMNSGKHNNWINIRLRGRMAVDGTGTNADGIGARVFVKTQVEGEEPLLQIKEVRAGSSYISMDSLDLEFGIGRASMVERIVVLWPSGRRQVLEDVSADQSILIVEPAE
jgi:hypothetical protein